MPEKVKRKNLKTITLVKRWGHHTDSGGYSRLRKEISQSKIICPKKYGTFLPGKINRKIWYRLMPSSKHVNFYDFYDMLAELQVFYEASRHQYSLVHSLYAEDQLNLLLRHRKYLKSFLVGTFHLPPESSFIQRIISDDQVQRFRHLDAAIVVSRSMVGFYEDWLDKGKVAYIPIGIDTHVFTPKLTSKSRSDKNSLRIIMVGSHGRDWHVIKKILYALRAKDVDVEFTAVIPRYIKGMFEEFPEVKLYSGISESELINLYRQSDLLLMPVRFATANNALLESLACGTPVISTNIGGIPDYLDDKSGWMLPKGDDHAMVNLLTELVNNRTLIREKEKAARLRAENFDWECVTNQILDFYREIENRQKAERIE